MSSFEGSGAREQGKELVRIATKRIDDTPALQAEFEENAKYLDNDLERLTLMMVDKAMDAIKARLDPKQELVIGRSDTNFFALREVLIALGALLKTTDRKGEIERLSKSLIVSLSAAGNELDSIDLDHEDRDALAVAIWHLEKASYSLCQFRFPEELKRQLKENDERNEERIATRRTELMKKRVS